MAEDGSEKCRECGSVAFVIDGPRDSALSKVVCKRCGTNLHDAVSGLRWIGSKCGVISYVETSDYSPGDWEPCVLCDDDSCRAMVWAWDEET